jgi:hypothetical protein
MHGDELNWAFPGCVDKMDIFARQSPVADLGWWQEKKTMMYSTGQLETVKKA